MVVSLQFDLSETFVILSLLHHLEGFSRVIITSKNWNMSSAQSTDDRKYRTTSDNSEKDDKQRTQFVSFRFVIAASS